MATDGNNELMQISCNQFNQKGGILLGPPFQTFKRRFNGWRPFQRAREFSYKTVFILYGWGADCYHVVAVVLGILGAELCLGDQIKYGKVKCPDVCLRFRKEV